MAKELRGNLVLGAILAKTEAEILSQWQTADGVEEREQLHSELKALKRFAELLEAEIRAVAPDVG
jgi:hypothetical protein